MCYNDIMSEHMKILYYPDEILKTPSNYVTNIDEDIKNLISAMTETMKYERGIGLAAPQVGHLLRVIVLMNQDMDEYPSIIELINPEITQASDEVGLTKEGCLSMPGINGTVKRPLEVTVSGLNAKGEEIEINAKGILATCLQHEIDHLDGVMFIDRMSNVKKNMMMAKYNSGSKKRNQRSQGRG